MLQGYKNVKSVERKIKVIPSGNVADIAISYVDDNDDVVKIKNGEEIQCIAGETLDSLSKTLGHLKQLIFRLSRIEI